MDGWRANEPDLAMSYFTRYDIPYHTALAQTFTICDAYHCSVMGPTSPNRLYLMSGTIDPGGTQGGPATGNPPKTPTALYHWKSYPKALTEAGVSWVIYDEQAGHPSQPPFDLNVAAYFSDWVDSPATHRTGDHRFEQDLAGGTLPRVSWIVPPYGYTEHPSFSPTNGAFWIAKKIQALIDSPYWSSSVFVLTYDENDGAFDHVPPPTPPSGTADELVSGVPVGPGFRVPCIVISPWSVGGRVSPHRYDHTSVAAAARERDRGRRAERQRIPAQRAAQPERCTGLLDRGGRRRRAAAARRAGVRVVEPAVANGAGQPDLAAVAGASRGDRLAGQPRVLLPRRSLPALRDRHDRRGAASGGRLPQEHRRQLA